MQTIECVERSNMSVVDREWVLEILHNNGISLEQEVTVAEGQGRERRVAVADILRLIAATDAETQREISEKLRLIDLMNGHILHYLQVLALRHSHSESPN